MPSTCPICQETFTQFFLYTMHKESHKVPVQDYGLKQPETVSERRNTYGVKHPVSDARKAELVARGEARLGSHHFIGGK